MSYIPTHFTWPELLPESIYRELELVKRLDRCALFLDDRILITADRLRQRYGKLVCNTWFFGGQHQFRGYRPQGCGVGALLSQHRFGRALDLVPVQATAAEIRADIRAHPELEAFGHITCVEDGVGWLHVDCRNRDRAGQGILFVKP
ncbi:hypothetical protein [Desulfocurvibacter africanus]|uniref:hypothetical protein n=1 Tax=Desulfocurvibacter africanus TaxID=873 RepID=UPI0003F991BB|nr:hypothetical protein [Desulfocurvibacter africanus]